MANNTNSASASTKFDGSAVENNSLLFGSEHIKAGLTKVIARRDAEQEHAKLADATVLPALIAALGSLREATMNALADDLLKKVSTINDQVAPSEELFRTLANKKVELTEEVTKQIYSIRYGGSVTERQALRANVLVSQLEMLDGPITFEEGTFEVPSVSDAELTSRDLYVYAALTESEWHSEKRQFSAQEFVVAEQSTIENRVRFGREAVLARLAENVANRKAFESAVRAANKASRLQVIDTALAAANALLEDGQHERARYRVKNAVCQLTNDDDFFGAIVVADQPAALSAESYQAKLDELAPSTNDFFTPRNIAPGYLTPVNPVADKSTVRITSRLGITFGDVRVARRDVVAAADQADA